VTLEWFSLELKTICGEKKYDYLLLSMFGFTEDTLNSGLCLSLYFMTQNQDDKFINSLMTTICDSHSNSPYSQSPQTSLQLEGHTQCFQ
jgi:hypothetical protein